MSLAQRAYQTAQAGTNSMTEMGAIAQMSLARQIDKVKEEFLALSRDFVKSDFFQAFAKDALFLAHALVEV